jgi:membrane-associated phospholipid phosphatase
MRRYVKGKLTKLQAMIALFSIELIVVLLLFAISLIAFFLIANRIFRLKNEDFDATVFSYIAQLTSEQVTSFMVFITFFATHRFLMPANILLILYFLFIRKHRWYSIKVPVVAIGSVALMLLLKIFFSRPRPLNPLLKEVTGFSFPSGHAMSSVTFYGLLIYITWHDVRSAGWRNFLIAFFIVVILLIGLSRIYLRVHYTSDVLAGFAMGVIWLVTSLFAMGKLEKYTHRRVVTEQQNV